MPALTPAEISAIDAAHVWHPYSTIGAEALAPVVAVGAQRRLAHGHRPRDADGGPVEVLDAMSSWWTAIHGHGHPALDAAITASARHDEPRHVRRADPRARGAAGPAAGARSPRTAWTRCSSATPARCRSRWRSKMALQYQRSLGRRGKHRLMTWRGRLSRRHVHPDERVRPRRRHALAVDRTCWPPQVFAPQVPADYDPAYSAAFERAARRARRRAGRRHRRAGGAGRGRHALPRPALPGRPARRRAPGTTCC